MSKKTKVLSEVTATHGGIASLLITVILVGFGERIGERYLPIYVTTAGASLFVPSILNALDNFLSAIYSFPGGWISSKIGYKKALLYFNLFAIIGYLIVIIFTGWVAIIIGSIFFLSWSSLSMPACMDLISYEVPKNKQVMGISLHSLIKRIPMALGPLLGGVLIDNLGITIGIRVAFILATIFGVVAIIVQQITLSDNAVPYKKQEGFPKVFPWSFSKDTQILLASDILGKFSSQIPYAYVAIWTMEYAKGAQISATQFGLLSFIEMICAIGVYIPVGLLGDKFQKKWFIMITFILYALFPVSLFFGRSFGLLIICFIIRGFKEFGEPTRKAQIMALAPQDKKALYFGAYYLYRDILVTLGVVLGGILWVISPELNLGISFLFALGAVLLYGIKGK